MSYTPGPWKIRIEGTMTGRRPEIFVEGVYYDDGSEFVVAETHSTETRSKGTGRWRKTADAAIIEANARLISAAPDLLAALKAVDEWLLDSPHPIDRRDLWNEQFLKAHDLTAAAIAKAEAPQTPPRVPSQHAGGNTGQPAKETK